MTISSFARAFGVCMTTAMWAGCTGIQPPAGPFAASGQPGARTTLTVRSGIQRDTPSGLSPSDLQSAYELPSSTRGSGQIVAIVGAFDNPNVASDLAKYRATFGLPDAAFTKYNQEGQQGNYPAGSTAWGVESDLDVEMVSASCPNCTIYLVEANSNLWSDLETAEAEAVTLGAHIVSNGFAGTGGDPSYFDTRGVTYVGQGGDEGQGDAQPADYDSVVAVGGTQLSKSSGKRGWTESVSADGGGCISEFRKPRWQHDTGCSHRLANDVSAAAYDIAAYDTYGENGWFTVDGGGSAAFIAGVFGLAGNAMQQDGGRTFWEKAHERRLYPVTAGDGNCGYVRGNYNTCAGWGSPHGIGAF